MFKLKSFVLFLIFLFNMCYNKSMRMIVEQKKIWRVFTACLLLIFCSTIFVCFPHSTKAENTYSESDLTAFNAAISKMIEYSGGGEVAAQAVSLTDNVADVEETPLNRLIVNEQGHVNDYGAVIKAECDNWHIFQYDSTDSADYAYAALTNSGFDVSYDEYVYCDDVEIAEAQNTTTGLYNTWGSDYIGYDEYIDSMLMLHEESELNQIVVAVLDSGINASHELFKDRILSEYAANFTSETSSLYSYEDRFGHGTHVSGTIAEATMSNVKILPLKVLNKNGRGEVGMIIAAIKNMISLKEKKVNPVNIVAFNMSIGVDDNGSGYSENTSLSNAVVEAYESGIIPVVSAGNESRDTTYACPANVEQAITVSALAERGNDVVFDASYSNYGEDIDFAAPGTNIISAGINSSTSYAYMSGTSMAAPHVTAVVALILSNPSYADYSQEEVYDLLKRNAVDYGDTGFDELYGWGVINIGKIGVQTGGNVVFDNTQKFQSQAFTLKLSLDKALFSGDTKIYYTTTETAEKVTRYDRKLYDDGKGITISASTKVTAIAYVLDKNTNRLQRSAVSSFTYYLNNYDLISNYTFRNIGTGAYISAYKGTELSTLALPAKTSNGRSVTGIYANAFSNSLAENYVLPSSIQVISTSAFNGNTNLKKISCSSASVEIGDYAFNKCSNLENVDIENITKVGAYAFAYCTKLNALNLMQAIKIDKHAFSGSAIKELKLGKDLQTFEGDQSVDQLDTVYGFAGTEEASPAESFANNKDVDFVDLTLTLASDAPEEIILKENEDNAKASTVSVFFIGVGVRYSTSLSAVSGVQPSSSSVSGNLQAEEYSGRLDLKLSGLEKGEYLLSVELSDSFGEVVTFNVQVKVVGEEENAYVVGADGNNFSLYIDEMLLQDVLVDNVIVKAQRNLIGEHTILITPENGYAFSKISVNGQEQTLRNNSEFVYTFNGTIDVNFNITCIAKPMLTITFETQEHGNIQLVDATLSSENTVDIDRNSSLKFTVSEQDGYQLKRVLFNGKRMTADENGVYTIENITIDSNVVALFEQRHYKVRVSLGKGGNLTTTGGADDSDIAFGESRVYRISVSEGYELDFVTINGQVVPVENGQFVLENIASDCVIVVSFKQVKKSVFSGSSVFLIYGFIFLAIVFVFVLAKIILSAVRKHNKKEEI